MPSKRKARPFKPFQERHKPQTQLQQDYARHQQQNLHDIITSGPSLSHHAKRGRHSGLEDIDARNPECEEVDPLIEVECFQLDLDGMGPGNMEEDQILMALNEASHQSARLEGVKRWERQYPVMFEAFLQCREKTNNWGNHVLWDQDFHPPCQCNSTNGSTREVVLVDILCE